MEAAVRLVTPLAASLKSPHQTVEAAVHLVTLLAASLKSKCPYLLVRFMRPLQNQTGSEEAMRNGCGPSCPMV